MRPLSRRTKSHDRCWRARRGSRAPTPSFARWALLPLLAVTLSCGEDALSEAGGTPARLLAVSASLDSVTAGERADPPVAVRVENALGDPVEGIPVRFLVASGEGEVENLAVSNRSGIAEANFRASLTPGESRVRADIPSATHVRALEFTMVTRPWATVALSQLSGDDQRAETGSQLARPFVVRAVTPAGSAAGGVPIAWIVTAPSGGTARLTADTTFTSADGRTQVLLSFGRTAGDYVVRAHATGGVASDTVSFSVVATPAMDGSIRLDSIRPLPLKAGVEAVLHGQGFALDLAANEVRVEGEVADVLEATSERLTVLVPDFGDRCLPGREVGVRTIVGDEASNGLMIDLEPRETPLDLRVGQARTFRNAEDLRCVQLGAADGSREYRVVVQSAARTFHSATPLRLLVNAGTEGLGILSSAALAAGSELDLAGFGEETLDGATAIRGSAVRELQRRRAAPARRSAARQDIQAALHGAAPAAGDTLRLYFAVRSDLTASCADTTNRVNAIVRGVGRHFIVAEDPRAPRSFSADDWATLLRQMDDYVYPTDTLYFGNPADIDGNGRVIALFTPEVNQLNARGAATAIGGFFLPLDLAASGREGGSGLTGPGGEICPASNEAEILYLAVADPEGSYSDPLSVGGARRNALGIGAHELQHLINAQNRVLGDDGGFGSLEEVWLDEALAHLAEELVGLRMADLPYRQNLDYAQVTTSRDAMELFNTFHINNFFQLSLFMLEPGRAPALSPTDPGGVDGLQMRGFSWFLVRWLADQDGSPGGRQLIRRLATGGPNRLQGVENVEAATGRPWAEVLADFAVALGVDDSGVEGLPERHRVQTWNFRNVFEGLNRNPSAVRRFPLPFPLAETPLSFESAALEFRLLPATAHYFTLARAGSTPALALSLASSAGGAAPDAAAPQITVVRTR